MSLQILPVLDIKGGIAVHAVAGRREDYRPLRSRFHPESDPVGLARGFVEILNLRGLYLADLDAIGGAPPSLSLYQSLQALGLNLWVDAGIRSVADVPPLLEAGVATIVVGLESVSGPEELARILELAGRDRVILSLDLREGQVVTALGSNWGSTTPREVAASAIVAGLRRLLILDLARVGTGRGTGTGPLLGELSRDRPELALAVGGGIAGIGDVIGLERAGATTILLGSTLHDGRIGPRELAELTGPR
ncbi:HisA/HisF-related TIM barrel protein [Singulisphaera sp. PoT]|uniref:HisA/HisF-related TIM barrel protein n=1 Tax=Singulisphaera sp. PoT TaxID=3411797 RepID=UPI003BF5CBDE